MEFSKRQKEIIDTAISLIAEKGIQNLTIKNVSQRIGISEAAIYRHFRSKHEIVLGILNLFEISSKDVLETIDMETLSSIDKIEAFILSRYELCSLNPDLAKVMFSEEHFQNNEELSKKVLSIMHQHKEHIAQYMRTAQKENILRDDIDLKSLFRIIFGPVRLLIKQWCLSGYAFDLLSEGGKLWEAEKKLLMCFVK